MRRDRVILRAQFNPRDILNPYDSTIRSRADHDVLKLFRGCQSTLRPDRVCVFLTLGHRLSADLTGWIDRILRLDGTHDVRHRDPEFCQLVGLYPQPHGILAGAKHLNTADAGNARQWIVKVDVTVICEKFRIIDAAG